MGCVGRDPWDERSWSGSSRNFFLACKRRGILHRALGFEAARYLRYPLILKNLLLDRTRWMHKFCLDPRYYYALTRAVARQFTADDIEHTMLELGAIYNVPAVVVGRCNCYSYHDGNVAELARSRYMTQFPASLIRRAYEYERRVYMGLDKIFTMSEYLRQSLIDDFGVPADRVVHIGVGSNFPIHDPLPMKDYDRKEVVFIGIDFERKRGNHLVRAFARVRSRFPDATLNIIGPSKRPDIVRTEEPGEVFHGFLSRNDPDQSRTFSDIMRRSTLSVIPSEPFGIAPLEAMLFEMPCILPNRWGFPVIVTAGETGELVEVGNEDELATKMIELLAQPDTLRRQGQAARKKVLSTYSWDKVAERVSQHVT